MAQVFGENTDGFIVGSLFTEGGKLSFNGRLQQAAVGILHGFGYMASAFVGAAYELAIESFEAFIVVRGDTDLQPTLGLGTADGEQAV